MRNHNSKGRVTTFHFTAYCDNEHASGRAFPNDVSLLVRALTSATVERADKDLLLDIALYLWSRSRGFYLKYASVR